MVRTVLIVEDTDFYLDALEVALGKLPGVNIRLVRTAEEALQYLQQEHITEVICAVITAPALTTSIVASPPSLCRRSSPTSGRWAGTGRTSSSPL